MMADGEVYEGDGEGSIKFSEDLFDELQANLAKLVRSYEINENDLRGLFGVIEQLWELLDKTSTKCEKFEDQKKDLEEIWNEEKEKRRLAEKRKVELENRFDEERYQWQSERQELQRDRVGLVTRIKHLDGRNKDLVDNLEAQSQKFEKDQKLRDDLVEQYKKQYEIAKTSTLKRKKNKKQAAGYYDYSTTNDNMLTTPSFLTNPHSKDTVVTQATGGLGSSDPLSNAGSDIHQQTTDMSNPSPRYKRQLPKNTISLRTELRHPKGDGSHGTVVKEGPIDYNYDYESDERYYEIETQEELLTSGPATFVVPTVAEVEMLKREQDQNKRTILELQRKVDNIREEREILDSDNAKLIVDVEHMSRVIAEFQTELTLLREERDEILESYLDQPFDVYCVTKKELHEVLKKLHYTQIEMQKQSEEKQTLEMQLLARRRKKGAWKRFAKKMRTIFHNKNTNSTSGGSNRNEEYEILVDPAITSCQIPPEAPFVPKSPTAIKEIENFHESRGWLVGEKGPHPSSLPSLYCQVMLKEYHVTDAISCMCLGRVYHSTQPLLSKRASILPLAARTSRGRLCVEVWVGSNEGLTTFIEIIDVLSKRVVDRFLVRGSKIMCIESVAGNMAIYRRQSSSDSRKSSINNKDHGSHRQQQQQQRQLLFEESIDLFGKDDKELQSLTNRNESGKSETDLRQYYKSRVQGRTSLEIDNRMTDNASKDMPSGSYDSKTKNRFPLTQKSNIFDTPPPPPRPTDPPLTDSVPSPPLSLASELASEVDLVTSSSHSLPGKQHSLVEGSVGLETSQEDSSIDVYTDDEGDSSWQTSTPLKNTLSDNESIYMWVSPDTNCIHIYNTIRTDHRPVRTLEFTSQPSCIRYIQGKVCVGLCDSRMIVYHKETIVSDGLWDLENPSYIELPKLVPENPLPVRDILLVRKKLWVTTGSFLTLLDPDILTSQGSKFLDATQAQPNKLLLLDEVVLVSTVKGSNIFLLDPERAQVIKKINISPASLILDNLLQLTSVNVTNLIKDDHNVYISTTTGKIFALPLGCFSIDGNYEDRFIKQSSMPDPNDITSASYPPSATGGMDHPLFKCTASSLRTHREGSIKGLLNIPLPENITIPMLSNSSINLSSRSIGLLNASSMPSLVSTDSPPLNRSVFGGGNLAHPIYRSLLVSCGKGYIDYMSDSTVFDGNTALREKNEAFQVIVWGYDQPSSFYTHPENGELAEIDN